MGAAAFSFFLLPVAPGDKRLHVDQLINGGVLNYFLLYRLILVV